jgi:DNA-binding transcriptional LysR family regulator
MDIPWDDLRLFLAVAETGSVSGGARKLRLGQPTVSRRLAALEYEIGEALFRRSVGGAALTAAGERLLGPARKMAEWAAEVDRAAEGEDRAPRGMVRITAPPFVAFDFVAPFAGWLRRQFPKLRLEVLAQMQYLDLGRGEADLALRGAVGQTDGLKVVCAIETSNAVFVAKSIAERLPRKPTFADLPWVAWAPPWDELPPNPQLRATIPGFEPSFTSDHFLVNLAAAEAGLGAMVLSRAQHRFSRKRGLVPLDIPLGPFQRSTMQLVCAKSAFDIPRIRLVAQLIEKELRAATEV